MRSSVIASGSVAPAARSARASKIIPNPTVIASDSVAIPNGLPSLRGAKRRSNPQRKSIKQTDYLPLVDALRVPRRPCSFLTSSPRNDGKGSQ